MPCNCKITTTSGSPSTIPNEITPSRDLFLLSFPFLSSAFSSSGKKYATRDYFIFVEKLGIVINWNDSILGILMLRFSSVAIYRIEFRRFKYYAILKFAILNFEFFDELNNRKIKNRSWSFVFSIIVNRNPHHPSKPSRAFNETSSQRFSLLLPLSLHVTRGEGEQHPLLSSLFAPFRTNSHMNIHA